MLRALIPWLLLTTILCAFGCQKSGATKEQKEAALAVAMETARNFPDVGDKIISLESAHGKMTIVIQEGIHPQRQREFIEKVTMDWFYAYPDDKRPTVNDMVQVWLYETDTSKDELGFMKMYNDNYGKPVPDIHHYKTGQRM